MRKIRNKKKKKQKQQSMLGRIIDLPLEEFKEEVEKQKLPIGVVHNIMLNLTAVYTDMVQRKDNIIYQINKGDLNKEDPKVKKVLEGLYSEMLKIEPKVFYLKDREKELINIDKDKVDSPKR